MSSQANKKRATKVRKDTHVIDVMDYPADPKALREELEKRLIIDPAKIETKNEGKVPISMVRKYLGFVHKDNAESSVILKLDRLYSYGVQENRDMQNDKLTGYSMSLSMYDLDGANERQLRTVQFINIMCEIIRDHLLTEEAKEEMQLYELEAAHLKKLNPLVYKKDTKTKKVIEGSTPTFYPKLIWYKESTDKNGKSRPANMQTEFYDEEDVDEEGNQLSVNPLDYIGKHLYATAAVKFDCFFGNAAAKNIQCKVIEAEVKLKDNTKKRLLRPSANRQAISSSSSSSSSALISEASDEVPPEEDEVKIPVPTATKTPVVPSSSSKVLIASDDEAPPEDEPVEEVKPKKKVVRKVKASAGNDK